MTRQFHASYIPLSALTAEEQQEYLNLLANYKRYLSTELTGSPAFRVGIRQRIVNERHP